MEEEEEEDYETTESEGVEEEGQQEEEGTAEEEDVYRFPRSTNIFDPTNPRLQHFTFSADETKTTERFTKNLYFSSTDIKM